MESVKRIRIIKQNSFGAHTPSKEDRKTSIKGSLPPYTLLIDNFPTYNEVKELILKTQPESWILFIKMGISVVHWKDQFSRTTGLNIASSKLKETLVKVGSATFLNNGDISLCTFIEGNIELEFVVSKNGRAFVNPIADPRNIYFSLYGDIPLSKNI